MRPQGFKLDTATGSTDLAWLLVQLFFITTFVAARNSAWVSDVAAAEGIHDDPIVVAFAEATWNETPSGDPSLVLETTGEHPSPPADASLRDWLATTCSETTVVEVHCPPHATHMGCQRHVQKLVQNAPDCRYRY